MFRAEDKYLCTPRELFLLQAKLKAVLPADGDPSRDLGYKITSVYFDTWKDRCWQEADDGVRCREKYRLRIYDDSFDTIKLEIKYKQDNRINKKSCTITRPELERLMAGQTIDGSGYPPSSPVHRFNAVISAEKLSPRVIVEYDRKAFLFGPGNVRITLDRNVRCSRDFAGFLAGNRAVYHQLPPPAQILEVKYDHFLPGFIARILENGAMTQTSYSKYKLCREYQEAHHEL